MGPFHTGCVGLRGGCVCVCKGAPPKSDPLQHPPLPPPPRAWQPTLPVSPVFLAILSFRRPPSFIHSFTRQDSATALGPSQALVQVLNYGVRGQRAACAGRKPGRGGLHPLNCLMDPSRAGQEPRSLTESPHPQPPKEGSSPFPFPCREEHRTGVQLRKPQGQELWGQKDAA